MGRPPCCDKANVKRGLWTAEEDAKILAYVSAHGTGNWTLVPKKAGLNRCGKSCRLRWTNYLRPDLKHESFSPEEEQLIINFHQVIGSRWSLIAKQLPGRTDNDVKNYWNTKLRKKLVKMGIDPVTHKPISQILSDYENISSIPNPTSHFPGSSSIATLNTTLLPQSPSPVFQTPSYSNLISNASTMTEEVDESFCDLASWNLLGQHQLIHHEALQHHFYNDIPSSCSSSSSPATVQLGSPKPGSFQPSQAHRSAFPQSSLHGVLSRGQLLPRNFMQNQESGFGGSLLCTNSSRSKENECNFTNVSGFDGNGVGDERLMNPCSLPQFPCKASSSTGNAFVDALLDRDSQIQSEFGELLDGILDY